VFEDDQIATINEEESTTKDVQITELIIKTTNKKKSVERYSTLKPKKSWKNRSILNSKKSVKNRSILKPKKSVKRRSILNPKHSGPKTKTKKLTEYFPSRRPKRQTSSELEQEQNDFILSKLNAKNDDDLDLKMVVFPGKGRGVVTTRQFKKKDFVLEYVGDIIDVATAKEREKEYSLDPSKGSYMYYFKSMEKTYCIDGTFESGRLGRLLNHSCKRPNLLTKVIMMNGDPRLIFVAKRDIEEGEELLFDYGERDKQTIKDHPWLLF